MAKFPCLAFLIVCLLFGGTSRAGAGVNVALEALSLAVLLLTVWLGQRIRPISRSVGLGWITLFLVIIYAIQLVPLPPQFWTALSGRDLIVRGYELLNISLPWRPLSLSQDRTIASAVALLPGLCALSLVLRMPREDYLTLSFAVLAVSTVSVIVGIVQIVGGKEAPLYWHIPQGGDSAHGFFANPNQLSTMLLLSIPLLAATAKTYSKNMPHLVRPVWAALAAVGLFFILGILASESTGGLVLLLPTLLASGVLLLKSEADVERSKRRSATTVGIALVALCVPFAIVFLGGHELSLGTSLGFGELDRLGIARAATAGIIEYWPYGSGLGTFPLVYQAHEDLLLVSSTFVNHAHNEYVELLFESGLFGAVLIVGVAAWWMKRSLLAWKSADRIAPWEQAASIAIAIIAVHSSFDYPARTPAILALGAAFCAILGRNRRLGKASAVHSDIDVPPAS